MKPGAPASRRVDFLPARVEQRDTICVFSDVVGRSRGRPARRCCVELLLGLRRRRPVQRLPAPALERALCARLFALAFHRALEALAIERAACARSAMSSMKSTRQAEGVVEAEGGVARNDAGRSPQRWSSTSSSRGRPLVSTASNRSSSPRTTCAMASRSGLQLGIGVADTRARARRRACAGTARSTPRRWP